MTKKLIENATVRNWWTYSANWTCKSCLSLYVVWSCLPAQIMYKNDGTRRINGNSSGHVVEFQMHKDHKVKFKTCAVDWQIISIDHFASYEPNENVSRFVFSYIRSVGKTADCLRSCTKQSSADFNNFIKLWCRDDNRAKLKAPFGKKQIDFTPLNLRIHACSHDRHVVKCYVSYIRAQLFIDRMSTISCEKCINCNYSHYWSLMLLTQYTNKETQQKLSTLSWMIIRR